MIARLLIGLIAAVGLFAAGRPAAAPAAAGDGARPDPGAAPVPVATAAPTYCPEAYSNVWNPPGYYFPAGAGVEVLDDLHLGPLQGPGLCAFDVGYYLSGAGPASADVTIYANDPQDGPPGVALATFNVPALLSGANLLHVEVPASTLTQDVWFGVKFDSGDAGLLLADAPWPGASDDLFLQNPAGTYGTFGGNPRANFMLGVFSTDGVTDVGPGPDRRLIAGITVEPAPNPTARGVSMRFALSVAGRVRADVLDVAGRLVARVIDGDLPSGEHEFEWDGRASGGSRSAAGTYWLKLTLPGYAGSRRVVLLP